jgi:hypothetical protein
MNNLYEIESIEEIEMTHVDELSFNDWLNSLTVDSMEQPIRTDFMLRETRPQDQTGLEFLRLTLDA